MKSRLAGFWGGSVAVLFCVGGRLVAQNEAVAPEAEAEKLRNAVVSKLRVVEKTAKEEAAAGRLERKILVSILSDVEFALDPGQPRDVANIAFFAKNHHPMVNAALDKAWDEFNSAVENWNDFVGKKLPKLMETRLSEIAKAWRAVKSSTELSDLIASIKGLRELAEESTESKANEFANDFREAADYLKKYQSLLAATEAGDVQLIGRAYQALGREREAFGGRVSLAELEERRNVPVRKLRAEAAELAKKAIDDLPQAKTVEQVAASVLGLSRASLIEAALTNREYGKWDQTFEQKLALAKDWQRMIELESTGALKEAANLARAMQPRAAESAPALAAGLGRRAESLGRSEWEAADKRKTTVESDFTAQLAEIKDAAAALALVGKVRAAGGEAFFETADGRLLSEALNELENIGRVWQAVESQSEVSIAALNQRSITPHRWRKRLAALSDQIRRDYFATRFELPELKKAPLDSLTIAEALETLTQEAVKLGDWRRVHQLLDAQASVGRKEEIQEDLAAVRAFIAGENYEKAQLFGDAVTSYKTVLRSVGRRSPLEAAGNRLKALKAEHPELFQPAAK